MGLFSAISTMFSGNSDKPEDKTPEQTIKYKDFSITPTPIPEGGQYRVAATISKVQGDSIQTHQFIRSDVLAVREDCIDLTIRKAKISIDQSGDNLF